MGRNVRQSIPEAGFGDCKWCGAEDQRLQYLMCPKCFRISNLVPSKAMILLNRPDLKKQLGDEGFTIKNLTPILREFITDPETHFISKETDMEHWGVMKKTACGSVSQKEVSFYIQEMKQTGNLDLPPTDEELFTNIGVENLLRFILNVCVIREILKMNVGAGEDEFLDNLCGDAIDNTMVDDPTKDYKKKDPVPQMIQSDGKKGMKARDIILKKYGR